MTIREAEERTGLTRSNIRFYEKERLVEPSRNDQNGYREYSEDDIERLKKIAFLRTMEISIEDIRDIISDKKSLTAVLEKQNAVLQKHIENLNKAKALCEKMLEAENVSFEELQIERYVADLQSYWNNNKSIFKLDSVHFLYIWGSFITWIGIAALCLIISILFFAKLPPEIPVQWNKGLVNTLVDKRFIFAYPIACIVIRILLRPILYAKLAMRIPYGELITEYLSNYMCFIALSAQVFTILFIYGLVRSIATVFIVDTVVLISILIVGINKMDLLGKRVK